MSWLSDLLKEYPALNVARERLALAEQRYELLERENEVLKLENARLKGENEAMRRTSPRPEFVESNGALFKRKADGTFEPIAYCPDCKSALSSPIEPILLRCSKCKYSAPFHKSELTGIISQLQAA